MRIRIAITLGSCFVLTLGCGGDGPMSGDRNVPVALRFAVSPDGASGGARFGVQPVVEVIDGAGKRVTSATPTITVRIGANPGSGTLEGTTTVQARDGAASFTDLAIDRAGTGYTLVATTDGPVSDGKSAEFAVTVGPATGLAFARQPAGAVGGSAFTTQPVVEITDAGGNRVEGATASIEIALDANPADGSLTGTTTLTAEAGQVRFDDLAIDRAGEGYTLVASASTLADVVSDPFDVGTGAPVGLAFVTQPAGASGGTPFATQPEVEIIDAGGNRVTADDTVRLALAANPPGGTLAGTLTLAAVDGRATFTDLSIDSAGTGYRLQAAADSLVPDTSAAFEVTVGPPARLIFTTQPAEGQEEKPLATQPVVQVADAGGNPVAATTTVSVAIDANPAAGTLSGDPTVQTDSDGSAAFTDLGIDRAAFGYTLRATATDLADGLSAPFAVRITYTAVTAGGAHGCGLSVSGILWCWGENSDGQLGTGDNQDSDVPRQVADSLTYRAVAAGRYHTCAATTADEGYCWGLGDEGQLGGGRTGTFSTSPALVSRDPFTDMAAGINQSCGRTTGLELYCWGDNAVGQLGDGTNVDRSSPSFVGTDYIDVNAGGTTFSQLTAFTCGTRLLVGIDGTSTKSYCWGENSRGQLGDGTTTDRNVPTPISGDHGFSVVDPGTNHACGIAADSTAYCWGIALLGDGSTTASTVPVAVAGGLRFVALSVGSDHACAVATDAAAYCWGENTHGELGDGTGLDADTPVPVASDIGFQSVSAGWGFTCGVGTDGAVYCWGQAPGGGGLVPVRLSAPWEGS